MPPAQTKQPAKTVFDKPTQDGPQQQAPAAPDAAEAPLLDAAILATAARMERVGKLTRDDMEAAHSAMQKSFIMAAGIQRLRELITPAVLALARSLMNTDLGFQTDRGPGKAYGDDDKWKNTPYGNEEVRDFLVWCAVRDFRWTGNEANILVGKGYGTQAGYKRKVRDIPGITDIDVNVGIPAQHNGQTVVRVGLSWRMNGRAAQLLGPDGKPSPAFAVRSNKGATAGQLMGKAERAAWKAAWEKATGSELTQDDELEVEPAPPLDPMAEPPHADEAEPKVSRDRLQQIALLSHQLEIGEDEWEGLIRKYGADIPEALTVKAADGLFAELEKRAQEGVPAGNGATT